MERYQEIERSIIKTYRGRLWAPFIKAVKEYEGNLMMSENLNNSNSKLNIFFE